MTKRRSETRRALSHNRLIERYRIMRTAESIAETGVWSVMFGTGNVAESWYASSGARRLFGLSANIDITDHPGFASMMPADRHRVTVAWEASLSGVGDGYWEYRLYRENETRWMADKVRFVRDSSGTICAAIGTTQDITDSKRAQERVALAEDKFRTIFNSVREAIFIHDAESGVVVDVNDTACAMYGASRGDIVGGGAEFLSAGEHPFTALEIQRRVAAAATIDVPPFEWLARTRLGERFWVEVRLASALVGSRRVVIAAICDVTARRLLEAEIEQYRNDLEALLRERTQQLAAARQAAESAIIAKSTFLANLSHEIRTPLNAISGTVYLMRREGGEERFRSGLDRIEQATSHLTETLTAVLEYANLEAGKYTTHEAALDIIAILAGAVAETRSKAARKNLRLALEATRLPAKLEGDAERIGLALLKYLENAVRFTEAGQITVRAMTEAESPDSVVVRFEVEDTGVGISPDAAGRLFAPFEQVDGSMTRRYGGVGLGLAVAKRLAELMGGTAGMISTLGKGSTFWFTVRLRRGPPDVPSAIEASERLRRCG